MFIRIDAKMRQARRQPGKVLHTSLWKLSLISNTNEHATTRVGFTTELTHTTPVNKEVNIKMIETQNVLTIIQVFSIHDLKKVRRSTRKKKSDISDLKSPDLNKKQLYRQLKGISYTQI